MGAAQSINQSAAPNPNRLRKDTKFGVLFRGCLWAILAAVTDNLEIARQSEVNFVLEAGAKNSGDAARLFQLAKGLHSRMVRFVRQPVFWDKTASQPTSSRSAGLWCE